jgi:hypothetical protein
MIKIFYRPAEVVEGRWQLVAEVPTLDDARDELESWPSATPHHGDLIRVVATNGQKISQYFEEIDAFEAIPPGELLYVFDIARSAFALVTFKAMPSKMYLEGASWVSLWEGSAARSDVMFLLCNSAKDRVDRRRLTLAACAVVEPALSMLAYRYDLDIIARRRGVAMAALEAARAWCRGDATSAQVKSTRAAIGFAPYEAAYANSINSIKHATSLPFLEPERGDDTPAVSASYAASAQAIGEAQYNFIGRNNVTQSMIRSSADTRLADGASDVRRHIPLSVLACALTGLRDPLPLPRDNPARNARNASTRRRV